MNICSIGAANTAKADPKATGLVLARAPLAHQRGLVATSGREEVVIVHSPKRHKRHGGRKSRFLRAYKRWGTIAAGARAAGVSRQTAVLWVVKDIKFRKRFENARGVFEDSIRERILRRADQNDRVALRLMASHLLKGKWASEPRRIFVPEWTDTQVTCSFLPG